MSPARPEPVVHVPVVVIACAALAGVALLWLLISRPPGVVPSGAGLRALPTFNAVMNGSCAALLVAGFVLVRNKAIRAHLSVMSAALVTSALFLGSYLYYHARAGSVAFTGQGWVRTAYFAILISHTVLEAAIVPLVLIVVYRAARGRFDRHKAIARYTLPLWLYVSVTGVVIYLMLYVWFPQSRP